MIRLAIRKENFSPSASAASRVEYPILGPKLNYRVQEGFFRGIPAFSQILAFVLVNNGLGCTESWHLPGSRLEKIQYRRLVDKRLFVFWS
jgi:hypothetical protein